MYKINFNLRDAKSTCFAILDTSSYFSVDSWLNEMHFCIRLIDSRLILLKKYFTDIDECAESETKLYVCAQQCHNKNPGFECRCDDGHSSTDDGRTCNGMNTFIKSFIIIIFSTMLVVQCKYYIFKIVGLN